MALCMWVKLTLQSISSIVKPWLLLNVPYAGFICVLYEIPRSNSGTLSDLLRKSTQPSQPAQSKAPGLARNRQPH